jgi:hypothetical protein
VQVRSGNEQVTLQIDEQGMPAAASFQIGKKTLRVSREYVRGTP